MSQTTHGLGRLVNHDPRSRSFAAPAPATVRSVTWQHYGPWLDQGSVGSCTGHALAQALNCRPGHLPRTRYHTSVDAVRLYTAATAIDPFPGTYPGQDTGSDGNSVCKAARAEGLIVAWQHAFGLDHMLRTLQPKEAGGAGGPVIVGTDWPESFFETDRRGFVSIAGQWVGGHEWLVYGVNVRDRYLWAGQSWGDWGALRGRFKVPFDVMDTLLRRDGDVILPIAR
jgi:hypothetical protein